MYTGFVLVNSVGYYLFNNMFINISTNIIGLLFITTLYKCNFLKKLLMVVLIYIINIIVESGVLYIFSYDMQTYIFWVSVYECITSMGILLIVVLLEKIIYVFLTIFLYLLKCPQSLILSALRAFCFCGKPHISRSIFLYFRYQAWLKSW